MNSSAGARSSNAARFTSIRSSIGRVFSWVKKETGFRHRIPIRGRIALFGAAVQALDPVRGAVLGGQQQDWHVALGAQPPSDLEAIDAGHHDVEDGQVGHPFPGAIERDLPIRGDLDVIALVDQCPPEGGGDLGIVVHDEHMRLFGHPRQSNH